MGTRHYFVDLEDGAVVSTKMIALRHTMPNGTHRDFDITQESTGTRRLIELLPALFDLETEREESSRVYVVDEFDRSFHSAMTLDLLTRYLESHGGRNKQLLTCVHDVSLMDEDLFRKDEIWICDKDQETGVSSLASVGTHKDARTDMNVLKAYKANMFRGFRYQAEDPNQQ